MKVSSVKSLKKQPFSIHDKLSQVDQRLEETKPIIAISRHQGHTLNMGPTGKLLNSEISFCTLEFLF